MLLAVASEAVEVGTNGRGDSAVINHSAVVTDGEVFSTPTPLFSSHPNNRGHLTTTGSNGFPTNVNNLSPKNRRDHLLNLVSVNTSNNNIINNDVNKSIT